MPQTFALVVSYDGTQYAGWQIQPNGVTIQQKLIDAIASATGVRAHVQGSGRTDSGVHAIGQVCSFQLPEWRHDPARLVLAINRFLPYDIVVRSCREVVNEFDPIRDATSKRYRYTIRNSRIGDPMTMRYRWWFPRRLSVPLMQQAANYLLGTHDFKAFETLGSERKTSVRTVRDLTVIAMPAMDGVDIQIEIEADGFLYNMVRNITGALVTIGTERFGPRWMETVLESKVRDSSSTTAPPQGLCLMQVHYPQHLYLNTKPTI